MADFSERVLTLVTDNGGCFISRHFHDYVSEHFNHVRIQYRTPAQLSLQDRFHGTLKDEEVYESVRGSGGYVSFAGRVPGVLRPDSPVLGASTSLWRGSADAGRCLLGRTGEMHISSMNDNRDISQDKSMDTQIKWINPCPTK